MPRDSKSNKHTFGGSRAGGHKGVDNRKMPLTPMGLKKRYQESPGPGSKSM